MRFGIGTTDTDATIVDTGEERYVGQCNGSSGTGDISRLLDLGTVGASRITVRSGVRALRIERAATNAGGREEYEGSARNGVVYK
jgi:hypothetical protein